MDDLIVPSVLIIFASEGIIHPVVPVVVVTRGIVVNAIKMEANGGLDVWMGRYGEKDNQSFLITSGGDVYINNTQGTGRINLHPSGNDKLRIYGSYNNNLGYHTGDSGMFQVESSIFGSDTYFCFVNGIFVGTKKG